MVKIQIYKSKYSQLPGTDYQEVTRQARRQYSLVQSHTKRQPYVRSIYFAKDKIFINIFWNHLAQKRKGEQIVRAKLLLCAFDLMRNTPYEPETIFSKSDLSMMLHRFYGESLDGVKFYVQIKQDKRTSRKDFMSVFPVKKHK